MISRISIGFLTPEYVTAMSNDGGLANYLHNVGHELVKRGHHVAIFLISNQNALWKDGEIDVVEVKRKEPPKLPAWLSPHLDRFLPFRSQVASARRAAKAMWNYHKKTPLDILQASNYMAPGFALRKNGKLPLITRVSAHSANLRAAYGRKRLFSEHLTDWLEIKQVLDSDAAFVPSQFIANLFEKFEAFRPLVILTPMNSTEITQDPSLYQKNFSQFPYFLFFGTLSRIKGIDLIADAIPEVFSLYPAIHFVFIGRDDGMPDWPKCLNYILHKAKDFSNRIHYMPAISKSQLYPIIAHSLAVVMPSRIDNYPNAGLESLSLGVPVVGSYDSSLEEMITDGVNGFLIKNGNKADLVNVLKQVSNLSSQERNDLKQRIQQQTNQIASEDRVGQLIEFYRKTIKDYK